MTKIIELYNSTDVKKAREALSKEQFNKCLVTGLPTNKKDFVLDHSHDEEQMVRGAIHRQVNVMLGKIENAWIRYISWWYKGTLSDLLRQIADYLEEPPTDYRHPGWLKKAQTRFNSLNETQKTEVLVKLGQPKGNNGIQRKELFRKALLTRKYSWDTIRDIIQRTKGS